MTPTTEARGSVWCRHCSMTFVVVGSPCTDQVERMQPELVVCPYCETMRRVILPSNVASPIARTIRGDTGEPYRRS
jgi:hypothetical protein